MELFEEALKFIPAKPARLLKPPIFDLMPSFELGIDLSELLYSTLLPKAIIKPIIIP
jgi:hypothetical protein